MKIRVLNRQYLNHIFKITVRRKNQILNWLFYEAYYGILSKLSCHYGVLKQKRDTPVVISFTTTLERISTVHLCIETLLRQSLKPDYIFLWLGEEIAQISEKVTILNKIQTKALKRLKKLKSRGLEIKFCKNIGSYNKIIHTLKNYPNTVLVTVDDDIFYHKYFLKELYLAYQKKPQYIHCHRARLMQKNTDGKFQDYKYWKLFSRHFLPPSLLVFPTGCAGVLYPPNIFSQEIFNEKVFMRICPNADDIWLKAMSLLNGVICKKIKHSKKIIIIRGTQKTALLHKNIIENRNNIAIDAVFKHYNLYPSLTGTKK